MHEPLSSCCYAVIRIEHVGEEDDPIRELFCNKCGKICDIADNNKENS